MCKSTIKVSSGVHFTKIGVTIATKLRHTPFYMSPNNFRDNFGNTTSGSWTWHSYLNNGKSKTKIYEDVSRKFRVKFQVVKIQRKKANLCEMLLQTMSKRLNWMFFLLASMVIFTDEMSNFSLPSSIFTNIYSFVSERSSSYKRT